MTGRILRAVEKSRVIPPRLAALGITHRQYRVLQALPGGATNKQIARTLGVTEATVKYHLSGLYRMTGTTRRAQLVDYMFQNNPDSET